MHFITFFVVPVVKQSTRLFAEDDMTRIRARAKEILIESEGEQKDTNAAAGSVAGAVVGGLMGGPIGLLLGMNLGGSLGRQSPKFPAKLQALGVDPGFVREAEDLAFEADQAREALRASEDAAESAKRYAAVLRRDRDAAQEAAQAAVKANDDATARSHLSARMTLDARVQDADLKAQDALDRQATAASGLDFIDKRAKEVDDLLARAIVAAVDGTSSVGTAPVTPLIEDPLIAKFRDLERGDRLPPGGRN